MLLVEADGKALFRTFGIPVPMGDERGVPKTVGPWIVKAQVPMGGRGKAGGVRRCLTAEGALLESKAMIGARLNGHKVNSVLIEQEAQGAERYLSLSIDPMSYGVRVIYLRSGGVEVEREAELGRVGGVCAPEHEEICSTLGRLLENEPDRDLIMEIGGKLASLFCERELLLAEINPLFVGPNSAVAGDAKVLLDLNAVPRQPEIRMLIEARPETYVDAVRKLNEGFDYIEIDPEGEIGLLTTGAGLSMMLIDELTASGQRPLNFLDIRTGQLRRSPHRIVRAMEWMTERSSLKVVLVNIFAGITDLLEFSELLADALAQTPTMRVPVVARLVGRGQEEAARYLAERCPGMLVTPDLQLALSEVKRLAGAPA
jgi:succinyl-CoA synthetase beta subunit